jgi:DNA-binding CsgD family transcriptional regulator
LYGAAVTEPLTGTPPPAELPRGALLERGQELARLREALEGARAGRGRTLVVDGPAGIGKTALLLSTRALAREGNMTILSGRGRELERDFPFGVARQLFEPELRAAEPERRAALLDGAAHLAQPLVTGAGAPAVATGEGDPGFGLVHGLYWLAANLAEESPVLVVVDDAHWVDAQTLRFLAYLAARSAEEPVLLLVAVRTGESDDPRLAELESDPATTTLAPHALSRAAVTEIVGAELGDDEAPADAGFCSACAELTGGNPFLLGELIAELRNEHVRPVDRAIAHIERVRPASVSRAVVLRLMRLGQDAQRLAHAVALLEKADLQDAAALAELTPPAARVAADLLCATRILVPPGAGAERDGASSLGFVHPLLRHAVYESIPPAARADGHRRAALLLARRGSGGSALVAHLLRGETAGDPEIVELCRRAAAEALAGGEPATALRLSSRALAEPAGEELRPLVLGELGEAAALARDPAAGEHLAEALRGALPPMLRVRLVTTLVQWLVWAGRTSEAHDLVTTTLEQFGDDAPLPLRAVLETVRTGVGSLSVEHIGEVEARLDDMHELALAARDAGAGLLIAEGCVRAQRGDWNGAWRALIEQGLGGGRYIAAFTGSSPIIDYAAVCLVFGDVPDRARAFLAEVDADAIARGSIRAHLNVVNWTGVLAVRLGDLAQGEEDGRTALELAVRHGVLWTVVWASASLGRALLAAGRYDEAEEVLEAAPLDVARGSSPWLHAMLMRARLRVAQGRSAEAIADMRSVGELTIIDNPSYVAWRSVLAQALGPGEEAAMLAQAELSRARLLGQPRGIGGALRAVAAAGGSADPIPLLEEAVSVLRTSPARMELANALCDLGAARRRAGQRVVARDPLREAAEIARACGATPLLALAREELAASGARPRRDRWAGPDALTPSERRVAELAAGGHTNREIAQALFVTTKTVGTHLGHIYSKLGLQGAEAREQLAGAMKASPVAQAVETTEATHAVDAIGSVGDLERE